MEHLIEEAFRVAILTEMKSYHIYCHSAATMSDGNGKVLLERLASEERNIVDEIIKYCPYPIETTADQEKELSMVADSPDGRPQRRLCDQLRIALSDKYSSIERYQTFVKTFRDPEVCRVFEFALQMSRKLFQIIVEGYRQADPRLQRPSITRRRKRTHIKPINRPAPNKHTELFISLLDSGRNSLF